jgi:hypothetical protein
MGRTASGVRGITLKDAMMKYDGRLLLMIWIVILVVAEKDTENVQVLTNIELQTVEVVLKLEYHRENRTWFLSMQLLTQMI